MKKALCIFIASVILLSCFGGALAEGTRKITPADDWKIITIDPGHGGYNGGAYRFNGVTYSETELVLKIAYYLKAELETYYHVRVILTRETNSQAEYERIFEITNRFDIAERHCSDLFVSLHINGENSHSSRGACVIVPFGNYRPRIAEECRKLGTSILSQLNKVGVPTFGAGLITRLSEDYYPARYPDGSIADYYGNTQQTILRSMVGVLVEHCFIDNYYDATSFLSTEDGLKKLAHADCLGIVDYLGLEKATAAQLAANEYCLTDYRNSWAKSNIDRAIAEGWVKGHSDDTFRPNDPVTRGEFVTMLGRATGVRNICDEAPFPDVPAKYYCAAYVAWAAENGIVDGFPDGLFHPDEKITREQMAKIMTCYLGVLGFEISGGKTLEELGIRDADSISEWAVEYVIYCYENKLLNGIGYGLFEPQRSASRAESCTVICRMIDYAAALAVTEPADTAA